MKRLIALLISCLFLQHIAFAQTPINDTHWQLKWEDQFNSFDNTKWAKAYYGTHGEEPQLYLEQSIWIDNSNLVIQVNNNKDTCPTPAPEPGYLLACNPCKSGKTYSYTSGWIETTYDYTTQYGYIEARIKLPWRRENGKSWGFFPAFWTFVAVNNGANVAEIDIFEVFGGQYKSPNTINTCIHRCYDCNNGDQSRSHTFENFDYRDWHTYAIEWNSDRLIWYLDGKAIRTTCNHLIIDPIRIILNLAVQAEKKYLPPTSPPWQEYMYVDYVKVHQLKCDKNTVVTNISNFDTYNYAVKKSISLDGATTIPEGKNIFLRAADFIELKPGFSVDTGRELYLDVTPCTGPDIVCVDYLTDQTITTNTTVTGCEILNIKDVDILNSATVGITAGEKVIIKPGFTAKAGTNVKVKIEP